MAEIGTHHVTFGESRPSIFEVLGHESLVSALRGAFRHIFKVLATNYPDRFGLPFRYFDEGFIVVDSVFQYIHLRLKGGLFTETFYGLKRIPDPRSLDVSKRKVITWVILAVVYPYLQAQLENLYKRLREKQSESSLHKKDFRQNLALFYLKVYPVYHFMWEIIVLGYYMTYAVGKTDFHSPLLHMTSTKLVPVTLNDLPHDAWKQHIPKSEQRRVSTILWNWINGFVSGVTITISIGAFATQFLDWWHSREGGGIKFAPLPIPPPPSKWPCDLPPDICPICHKKRTNDTALRSSGFVFCYPCIFKYVQETGKCPVTGFPASLNQLVKLYHQD